MAERRISILIDTKGDVSGIDHVADAYGRLQGQADGLFGALKAGAAIDIGGRLVSGIAAIPAAMDRAIERGVQFNAVLETSALGIAAVLKQFDTAGQFKTFDDAMAKSAEAIDLLKQKAKESPATFQSLVQSYQALAGPLSAANIPMERQIDLIVNMSQALSGLGISSQQLLQETRALVTGNINADAAAAKILGVTAADVNGAKERGQLYEFLSGKISAFAEAGKRGAQTYQTATSNLEDAIDDVLAKVTQPIFEAMTKGTLDLSAALNDPAIVDSLRDIGEAIASLIASGYDLTQWAIENRDALIFVAKAAGALGVAYTAVNVTHLLMGLGLKIAALLKSKLAIDAETAALARNTAAQVANGAARAAGAVGARVSPDVARAANLGRFSGSVLPAAAAAAPAAASAGGITVAGVSAVVAPLVIAAIAGWLVRAQLLASSNARVRRVEETGERYTADVSGNAKAMSSMVNTADRLAVLDRIRSQEAKAQQDIYEAIGAGDAVRVQQAEQQLKFLALQRSQVDGVFERVHAINGIEADRLRQLKETEEWLKKSNASRDDHAARLADTQAAFDATRFRTATDPEKLGILDARRSALPSADTIGKARSAAEALPAGKERDAALQVVIEAETKILEIAQQREAVEKSIADKLAGQAKELADQAKKLAEQQQARADYVLDMQITEARVRGLDKIADRLENEKKLREEIRRVMEATGATEAEAERAARRKLSIEWQLAQQKKDGASQGGTTSVSSASSRTAGDKIGITGGIGEKDDGTISIYDNRAVGRLRFADANGRIPLNVAEDPETFGNVVPRPRSSGVAGSTSDPSGSVGGGGSDLAGEVRTAADAVKQDATPANLAALGESLRTLGAAYSSRDAAVTTAINDLTQEVRTLAQSVAAGRTLDN